MSSSEPRYPLFPPHLRSCGCSLALPTPNLLPRLAKHTQSSPVALLGCDKDQEGPDPEEGMRGAVSHTEPSCSSPALQVCALGVLRPWWGTGTCLLSGMHPDSPVALLVWVFSQECKLFPIRGHSGAFKPQDESLWILTHLPSSEFRVPHALEEALGGFGRNCRALHAALHGR